MRIAIAGAGITGLSLAHSLRREGHHITVFEARQRPGGAIHTVERDGFRLETGPHTLLIRHCAVLDLIDELDLGDEVVDAGQVASKRYVVRDGQPLALPSSPLEAVTTPLLSPLARLRILFEPFVGRFEEGEIDETLASFVARRLGPEVLQYLVDPFVGGIFAGDPELLSARHTFPTLVEFEESSGSIAIGAIRKLLFERGAAEERVERRLISFRAGMATLVEALRKELEEAIELSSPIRKLRRDEDQWRVIYQRGKARRGASFDAVVLTMPTYALPDLEWENIEPSRTAIEKVAQLPYAPCSVVSLGYDSRAVNHDLDGFGMLVPAVEDFHILGTLFVSSMFEGRAPKGQVLLTSFVGGARQPELTESDDKTLFEMTAHDLGRLLDISGPPAFSHITRWERAIPQYEVGHHFYLDQLDRLEDELPGIFFAGNFREGVGVPALIRQNLEHHDRIEAFLANKPN